MITKSKYTKALASDNITRFKYNELYDFAVLLRQHKNNISLYVNNNLLKCLEYTKLQFIKEMRSIFKDIPSSFDYQLHTQVFVAYQNKFDAIVHKLTFEKVTYIGCETYKRDTKGHRKGDFKKVNNKRTKTPLSICLTYLARYGNADTLKYIQEQLSSCDEKKRKFYQSIIDKCGKFGFQRLLLLALRKRNRTIRHYSKHPIEFKSLSFGGRCRKTRIVDYNKRFGSTINAFVSLSGLNRKSFDIPVKFSKEYHGRMGDYQKPTPNYEYVLTFNEKKHQVTVNICKDGERYVPQANGDVVGIDVNVKHNLFSLSNGVTYDYDRKLVNDFCKLSKEIDELKKDKAYKVGKRKQFKLNALKHKIVKSNQQLVANMCKELQAQGIGHVVMENLDNGFGKCYVKDADNEGVNFNRVVKFLGISTLKNEVEHIARKYDIAVSLVHSSYTSKMCPICGCIEDENRPNQETFSCIECGYTDNADHNAAINIRNRVSEAVLRNALLKPIDNGVYEPKKLKREKVKEVLLSFRRNLPNARSECT